MKGITISKKEALARLSDEDPIEYRIEKWENDGVTEVGTASREWLIERINKSLLVYESGEIGQSIDFGIHIDVTLRPADQPDAPIILGHLFMATKPIYRLTKEQLEDSLRRGCGTDLFSS